MDMAVRAKTVEDRVKDVIAEQVNVAAADIKPEDHLADNLGVDSLDNVEILMALEDEFDIDILDEDVGTVHTVQQAIDMVNRILSAK